MKKGMLIPVLALLLTGCSSQPVYETIGNVWENPEPVAVSGTIEIALPEGAQMEVMQGDNPGQCYWVGEWEIWTQVYPGGDVRSTLTQITGLEADALTVIERKGEDLTCYETAWSATEEDGLTAGRTAVLDDGSYHYCISVTVPEGDAEQIQGFFAQTLNGVKIVDTAP